MDNLIKGAVNKIKQFATTTFKQAPQALQNYATAYGKVSPYIPFAPKLQTPQQVKQNWSNISTTYNKLPTPVKKFGEGFVESSALGLYDMPAQKSQNNFDRAGYVGGYVAGIVNPLNPANKIFGALNIGEKIATPAISKIAPKATGFIATKLLPNIAGEATQTAGYMALKNLSERTNLTPKSEGNFGEQLAYGLLGRGAFGVIGKNLPGQLKVQAGKIGDDDVKALGAIMKRATTNWTDGNKINLNQYSKDINLVDEILVSKYGATKEELKKIPEIDRIKNLFSMAMEDYRGYQIKGNNLVSNLVDKPSTPQGGVDALEKQLHPDDVQILRTDREIEGWSDKQYKSILEEKIHELKYFNSGEYLQGANQEELRQSINELRRTAKEIGKPELAILVEKEANKISNPEQARQYIMDGLRNIRDKKFELFNSQPSTQQVEQPAQKIKVTKDGKIKVTPQTPELTQPKIDVKEKLGNIMYEDRQKQPYPWSEWNDKLKRWVDPTVPDEILYGKKGFGIQKPKRELPTFTKENIKMMADEAKGRADINEKEFMESTSKWIAERNAAKTTGVERGLKLNVPDSVTVRDLADSIEIGTPSTPEVGKAVKTLKIETDKLFQDAKNAGVDLGYREDYIPHAWKETPEQVRQLYKTVSQQFGFSGERTIPTYEEGIKMGLTPKFNNPKQLIAEYVSTLEKTKANINYINNLKAQGVIVPKRAPGLIPITAPGFQAPTIRLGDETIREGMYYAPPKIADTINKMFSEQQSFLSKPAKVVSTMQDVAWSGGIPTTPINAWTAAQTTKEFLAGRVKGPLKALWNGVAEGNSNKYFSLPENLQSVKEQQLNNIPIRTSLDIESLAPKSTIQKVFGSNIGEVWGKVMNEPTFKRFMPTLQNEFYKDARKAAINSGLNESEAIKVAAKATQNFYGLKSTLNTALANKTVEDFWTTAIAAPKYRNTMINFWFNNLKALKNPLAVENRANVKFTIGAILTLTAMDQLNRKFTGKSMIENPKGKEDKLLIPLPDGTVVGVPFLSSISTMPRLGFRVGKSIIQGDIKGAVKDATQTLASVAVKPLIDVGTNQDYFGKPIVNEDSAPSEKWTAIGKYLGSQYLTHPYLKELTDPRNNQDPAYQRLSRAMELPLRYYDKKSVAAGYYYGAKDTAMKGMSEQEKQAFNAIPKADTNDPNTRILKYQIYLTYPEVFKAKQKIEFETASKTGKAIDPLYLVNYETAKKYMRYETLPEGSQDRKDMTKAYPELLALFDTRSKFFKENPIPGQVGQQYNKPIASPYVQAQMDAKNWTDPQVRAYLDANTAWNNTQREKLGLPPLAGFSKFPSSVKKPKKISLRKVKKGKTAKFKTISTKVKKLKTIKGPTFKAVKTKQPKIKVKMPKIPKFA